MAAEVCNRVLKKIFFITIVFYEFCLIVLLLFIYLLLLLLLLFSDAAYKSSLHGIIKLYYPVVDPTITPQQMEALNYYKKNTMSVEIIKDDSLQKINFRVKNKVGY